jgi:hypothetical protein
MDSDEKTVLCEIEWDVDFKKLDEHNISHKRTKKDVLIDYIYEKNQKRIKKFNSNFRMLFLYDKSVLIRNKSHIDFFHNSEFVFIDGNYKQAEINIKNKMSDYLQTIKSTWSGGAFTFLVHEIIDSRYYKREYDQGCPKFSESSSSVNSENKFWNDYLINVYEIEEYTDETIAYKWHPSVIIKQEILNKFKKTEVFYAALRIFDSVEEFKNTFFVNCISLDHMIIDMKKCIKKTKGRKEKKTSETIEKLLNRILVKNMITNKDYYVVCILNGTLVSCLMESIENIIYSVLYSQTSNIDEFYHVFINVKLRENVLYHCQQAIEKYYEFLLRKMCIFVQKKQSKKTDEDIINECYKNKKSVFDVCDELRNAILEKYMTKCTVFSDAFCQSPDLELFADHIINSQ